MVRIFISILFLFIAKQVYADIITDFYYAAKRNIEPSQFHRARYLEANHGSRYIFNEKQITANALIGISSFGVQNPAKSVGKLLK